MSSNHNPDIAKPFWPSSIRGCIWSPILQEINEINGAMTQLDTVTQNNAALSEELASTSEEMNSQAVVLEDLMGFFTVDSREKRSTSIR